MGARVIEPARLRLARRLRGFTQKGLAEEIGVSPPAISQFESGAAAPSHETLERLALELGCAPEFFLRPLTRRAATEPFFRRLRSTPLAERERAAAYAEAIAEIVELIERHVELPEACFDHDRWITDETPLDELEHAALRLRAQWGVPPGPIANVVRLLEARGAVVAAVGVFHPSLDAFSVRTGGRPVIVLCSEKGAAARRRFDAAHELAHLLLHERPLEANKVQERQAHRFAAALLMPAEEIEPWLVRSSTQLGLLEEGSRVWGVSMQALLMRARDLGTISQHAYERTMRRMSARGWRTREPVEMGPVERPELLARAAGVLEDGGSSLSQIAEEFGVPRGRLARMLSVPEDNDDARSAEIVTLRMAAGS